TAIVISLLYQGASIWFQKRVESEIEAAFVAIRSAVATASYDRVDVHPFSRTVVIKGITLQASAAGVPKASVGQLVLSGMPVIGTAGWSASRMALEEIEVKFDTDTVQVESLIFDDVTSVPAAGHLVELLALAGTTKPTNRTETAT